MRIKYLLQEKLQNTSSAVMQQKKPQKQGDLNDYPTPPWATRGMLNEIMLPRYPRIVDQRVWEPCCNRGYMAEPLKEVFKEVHCSDIIDYGYSGHDDTLDFLSSSKERCADFDWIITNPPFSMGKEIIQKALDVAHVGVAVITRVAFLEGGARYRDLFSKTPPTIVAQCVERVPMVEGRYDADISSATAYCWLIWEKNRVKETILTWIPPCKAKYYKDSDRKIA